MEPLLKLNQRRHELEEMARFGSDAAGLFKPVSFDNAGAILRESVNHDALLEEAEAAAGEFGRSDLKWF